MDKKRILVGSPIRQKPAILKEFLESLCRLKQDTLTLEYFFIDDNEQEESHKLLADFKGSGGKVTIFNNAKQDVYICDDATHHWSEDLIWKVASFKNRIIQEAVEKEYDYLFLVDSDLLLNPETLKHLVSAEKDIVSEIFWTSWSPDSIPLPNVWISDGYNLVQQSKDENLSSEQQVFRMAKFLAELRMPGIYKVGGLGACTLISRKALLKGINYDKIYNLTLVGEDRHFCVRAAVLGFDLFVDTHYPCYHIYRESDLSGIERFKSRQ
jgi:hypothetical protein